MRLHRLLGRHRAISSAASVHWTAQITESTSGEISIAPSVRIGRHTWLNTPAKPGQDRVDPRIEIATGSAIGRGNVISALNRITIAEHVVTAPHVLIMDHAHEFADPHTPILLQGVTDGGSIALERGCWIGFGAVIVCNRGTLTIGANSVVAANSVVTADVPPRSVVAGTPARVIRRYNEQSKAWEREHE